MQVNDLIFVALVGTVRQIGPTRAIANTLDELAPDDVQVDLLDSVGELPHFDEDDLRACLPKHVIAMSGLVGRADGVVIVTPEYNRSVPGMLKNALDWLGKCPQGSLAGKPVAIQTFSLGMFGGVRAQDHLRQTLLSLDAVVLNKPEIAIPHVTSKIDAAACLLRDRQTRYDISMQLKALAKLARDTRTLPDPVSKLTFTLEEDAASRLQGS